MKYIVPITILMITLSSCKKEEANTNTPSQLYGIYGTVNLYDEGSNAVSDSGMIVTIEGLTPVVMDTTDNAGDFEFDLIVKGTYTLRYEKPGYGTFKLFDIDHTKNESTFLTPNPSLGEKSSTEVTTLSATITNDTLVLDTDVKDDLNVSKRGYFRTFFGKNSDLSVNNYDHYSGVYERRYNPFELKFPIADLLSAGFNSGDVVYVNVGGESYFSNDYFDPTQGKQIFPNVKWMNNTVSFTMP